MVRMFMIGFGFLAVLVGTGPATASMPLDTANADADAYSALLNSENVPGWEHDFEYT
jgi:hypothetical protein